MKEVNILTTFAERLKHLRKNKELTQEKLAEVLNISKSSISMYENGNREPDFENLEIIADFFNVDLNYLLGKSDLMNTSNQIVKNSKEIERINVPEKFETAEEALRFILDQPALMAYGGYDLKKMSEEEIIDIAENMLFSLKLSLEKRKKNRGE
jgi:transcriptional regulator with XRE-family HTH domain